MAKIHKVEFYFVDYNDFYKTSDDLLYNIDSLCDGLVLHPECKTSKSFEWYDDINLNHYGCSKDDCEKYFLI